MSYDEKCHDLAVAFLSDYYAPGPVADEKAKELAQIIQDAIEDFLFLQGGK